MIIEGENLTPLLENGSYNCKLLYKPITSLLKDDLFPLGKLLAFQAPVTIGSVNIPKCLIFAGELRVTNMFGMLSFQRYLVTQLGSILTSITSVDHYVEEGCILREQQQISINAHNSYKEACLFNIFMPLDFEQSSTFGMGTLNLTEDQLKIFMNTSCDVFDVLAKQLFKDTCDDHI
jgi:hypothetical protein